MATLYITEFSDIFTSRNDQTVNMALQPYNNSQTVAIGATSAQSTAIKNNTLFVRLFTDTACAVEFGTNPTAVATSPRMAANQTEYFAVPQGQSYKIATLTP